MRLDDGSIKHDPVNPYNAATEKVAALRRTFQARKKPVKRVAGVQAWVGVDQAAVIGQWMNGGCDRTSNKDHRETTVSGKDLKVA
jgi:hypothetical protein